MKLRHLFAATALAVLGGAAHAQAPDTSDWECSLCPFQDGSRSDYGVGASVLDDDAARFGDAIGYDDDGGYLDVDGTGNHVRGDRRLRWNIQDLGLESRVVEVGGGRPGHYDYRASYRQLPHYVYDTTRTIFAPGNSGSLSVPSNWDPASWMSNADYVSAVNSNVTPRDIESERKTLAVGGDYIINDQFAIFADYSREERDGVDIVAGANFTQAALLPRPFDYQTDQWEFGVRYRADWGSLQLAYYGSTFDNSTTALSWDNPFLALPGAERGQLAQPPDNNAHQLNLSGTYRVSETTLISFSGGLGSMEQDDALLPYTINPNLTAGPLPRTALDGNVDTSQLALRVTGRPLPKTRVRFTYRYDDRDNGTSVDSWDRIIVDGFVSGDVETNLPYSFQRTRLSLEADYELFDTLRLSAGYERRELERDLQEVAEQTEDTGYGRLRWRPNGWLDVRAEAGTARRDIDRYDDAVAIALGQNPLLRKYNLAYRYREFAEMTATATLPDAPVTINANFMYADDSYTRSVVGLTASDETLYGVDIAWQASADTSVYLHSSWQDLDADQAGSEFAGRPDWRAITADSFQVYGAGVATSALSERLALTLDFTHADGASEIAVLSAGGGASRFPDVESDLDTLRLMASYRYSERLRVQLELRYENFEMEDWALQGVTPTAIPTVLTLGAVPYDYDVLLVGISFRYGFGNGEITLAGE